MTPRAEAGRIETSDIEHLQQVVRPWDVVLRQMSPGKLRTRLDYVLVNGIMLYREQWSHRIVATGATPAGFFFFGGPASRRVQVDWCGGRVGPECLAFGRSSSEMDFVTPNEETHICLLVPHDLMLRYLGGELAARVLPRGRFLSCHQGCGAQLLGMMERILDKYLVHRGLLAEDRVCEALEWQLLGGLVEFLLTSARETACLSPSVRYPAVRRAIQFCDRVRVPIAVPELAAASGVSTRVLELGFREVVQVTPRQFIRWNRMNRVHKELLTACKDASSVTEVASSYGITELGRFAVDYKNLFGESPSTTLVRHPVAPVRRIGDVLCASADG